MGHKRKQQDKARHQDRDDRYEDEDELMEEYDEEEGFDDEEDEDEGFYSDSVSERFNRRQARKRPRGLPSESDDWSFLESEDWDDINEAG